MLAMRRPHSVYFVHNIEQDDEGFVDDTIQIE
jgi:hypothetical protein